MKEWFKEKIWRFAGWLDGVCHEIERWSEPEAHKRLMEQIVRDLEARTPNGAPFLFGKRRH